MKHRKRDFRWMELAKEALKLYRKNSKPDYSDSNYWYQTGKEFDENKIDVFYSLSTTLIKAVDENGNQVLNSTLCEKDREIMAWEYEHMSTKMFDSDHFNFIAPYYRQMTFETYDLEDKKQALSSLAIACNDICNAFDYYMEHINKGRPFILAGFSQGGVMTQTLLMHMSDEQYSRMIVAYSIGFEITEKELESKHIKPATSADDLGTIVSYNSVASVEQMWDQIEGNAVVCINPLNWKTDATVAKLLYDGDSADVHVDQQHQVLVVEGLDTKKYDGIGYPLDEGVYHMWDIRFYVKNINENAIHRANIFLNRE